MGDFFKSATAGRVFWISLFFLVCTAIIPADFTGDEGTYSLMTKEMMEKPSLVTSVTSENTEIKMPFYFWVNAVFASILRNLPIQEESAYRLCSAVFGAVCVYFVFKIGEQMYDQRTGFFASMLYMTNNLLILSSKFASMESLATALILASIYYYLKRDLRTGALLLFLATFTKSYYILIIPLIVIAYWMGKSELKPFIVSFMAAPLALGIYLGFTAIAGTTEYAINIMIADINKADPGFGNESYGLMIGSHAILEAFGIAPALWFLLLVLWLIKRPDLRADAPVLIWLSCFIIVMLVKYSYFFYYMPILPALCLITAKDLSQYSKKEFPEKHIAIILLLLTIISQLYIYNDLVFFNNTMDARSLAELSYGKNLTYVGYRGKMMASWSGAITNLEGTTGERILIENFAPTFLYYRFRNMHDYGNFSLFICHMDCNSTSIESEYIALKSVEVRFIKVSDKYRLYDKSRNDIYVIFKRNEK